MLDMVIKWATDLCCLLKGGNLATVTRGRDYQVLVGSAEGSILSLTETELVFRPPSKEPSPWVNEEKLFIRVSNYFFFLNFTHSKPIFK